MANATVAVSYADVAGFPEGASVDHIMVAVSASGIVPPTYITRQRVPQGTRSLVLNNLEPGDYDIGVWAEDADNAILGSPISGSFKIKAPVTVTLTLPSSVSVTPFKVP